MDGWIRLIDGWMDRWINGYMDQVDGYKQMDRWMDGLDGWMGRCIDRWIDRWMDRQLATKFVQVFL